MVWNQTHLSLNSICATASCVNLGDVCVSKFLNLQNGHNNSIPRKTLMENFNTQKNTWKSF